MAEMVIDKAGKVSVDRETDTICIDGVRCGMEMLPHCVNPDPKKFYRGVRKGPTLIVTIYDRDGVWTEIRSVSDERAEDSRKREQLDELGHGIAYSASCTLIESNCVHVDGCDISEGFDWFDVSAEGVEAFATEDVAEAVKYLEMRGLIDRHKDNPNWVQLRDEDEPRS